jgi:hypothetical protein
VRKFARWGSVSVALFAAPTGVYSQERIDPATEQSVVCVLYDDDNLYIGAVLYESEIDKLMIPGVEQDFRTENSDMFGIAIDAPLSDIFLVVTDRRSVDGAVLGNLRSLDRVLAFKFTRLLGF